MEPIVAVRLNGMGIVRKTPFAWVAASLFAGLAPAVAQDFQRSYSLREAGFIRIRNISDNVTGPRRPR